MDELKALMGENYQEGMSVEEIGNFFKGKKFADLSTGKYVDKNKYESDVNDLNSQLKAKKDELNAKLTDDEKSAKAQADKDKEIEDLKKLLSENKVLTNKATVKGTMSESKTLLDIKDDNNDYNSFVDNITSEDGDKSTSIASYVAKLVKDAYEKGKKDATKNNMGAFGTGKIGKGENSNDGIGNLGKQLASRHTNENKFDYFAKK